MLKSLVSRLKGLGEIFGSDSTVASYQLRTFMETDTGCVRTVNQDSILYIKPTEPKTLHRKGVLTLVCDGMGGHSSGELASEMTVSCIEANYYNNRSNNVNRTLKNAFNKANKVVYQYSQENPKHRGMGTTATALVIRRGFAYFLHVGDSRLYLVRNKEISQLTSDDTVVAEMVRQGVIDANMARNHDERNVVTQALGTKPKLHLGSGGPFRIQNHDIFILCSDGLYDLITDDEICAAVTSQHTIAAGKHLINTAKNRGGYDNISLVLLQLSEQGPVERTVPVTRY